MIGTTISNHGVTVDVWNHASGDIHDWWDNYILSPEFAHLDFFETLDYLCNFNARKTIGSNLVMFDSEADFTMFLLRFS